MKVWIPLILVGLFLAGCQMQPGPSPERIEVIDIGDPRPDEERPDAERPPTDRIPRQIAFPAQEYAVLERTGTAAISGRLRLNGSPGGRETVSVAPVTTYSAEAAEHALAGRAVEPADPRAREYTHTTRTDANGHFVFQGLPGGDFYVSGSMVGSRGERQVILHQVSLRSGQHLEVDLSR